MKKRYLIFFVTFLIVFFVMLIVNQDRNYNGFIKRDFANSYSSDYYSYSSYSPDNSIDSFNPRWNGWFVKKYWGSNRKCKR